MYSARHNWQNLKKGEIPVSTSAESIAAAVRAAKGRGLPPVHKWNPPFCGDLDMRIARDGTWFYLGTPIGRPALVRLFSTVLKREGASYFLVTPVEKVGITVDDVPFLAVDFDVKGTGAHQTLTFHTSLGDQAIAGPDHPLRFDTHDDAPAPYVDIRAGLEALIDRKSFFRLVDLGAEQEVRGTKMFGVWSGGQFFPIAPVSAL
ncbi:DUF1285 domain-containing protein [Celeribacter marinus]|uniref:Proteophosphoglycan n=1 Tax=Celeribacter marinus TaxID=1397108 RepID=A0A0N9ZH85_9RHOB|nr:DUF1285 domain-containing protein [Celeribacter marinus]ALI55121.1 Proteophosphoglycan precursor [Celeribacter marinus]SFK07504.1 hypothetical protein SAMN05444421_101323 [Celeribacter marinus]